MATYRSVRNEPRVGVGDWTGDLRKGQVVSTPADIPPDVAEHLVGHGVLVEVSDDAEDNEYFDSEDVELSGTAFVETQADALAAAIQEQAAKVGVDEDVTVTVDEAEVAPPKGKGK